MTDPTELHTPEEDRSKPPSLWSVCRMQPSGGWHGISPLGWVSPVPRGQRATSVDDCWEHHDRITAPAVQRATADLRKENAELRRILDDCARQAGADSLAEQIRDARAEVEQLRAERDLFYRLAREHGMRLDLFTGRVMCLACRVQWSVADGESHTTDCPIATTTKGETDDAK